MHVLYVIDSLVPAGAERSLAHLAPRYAERGVQLDIAYLHDRPGLHDAFRRAGAQLYSLGGAEGRIGWTRGVHTLIQERRPDIVHTTLFEADVAGRTAARLAGVPVVSTLANDKYGADHFGNPELRRTKVLASQLLDAATARLVSRLHAVSVHVADTMARRLCFPRRRIDVIPRGRDPEALGRRTLDRRAQARADLGIAADAPVLLAVARQDHHKGLDTLLRALVLVRAHRSDIRLLIAGRDGSQTRLLHELEWRLGLSEEVKFLGVRHDVPDLLCAADVFVLPSRREGLPGSVLEAMALELPIVVSDLPQVREVVDGTCAELVPTGSAGVLANAIEATLANPTRAASRVERARDRFLQRFAIDRVSDQMLDFYDRALTRRAELHLVASGGART